MPVTEPAASPGPSFLRPAEEHMSPINILLSQHAIKARAWAPWLGPPLVTAALNMTHSALDLLFCVLSDPCSSNITTSCLTSAHR